MGEYLEPPSPACATLCRHAGLTSVLPRRLLFAPRQGQISLERAPGSPKTLAVRVWPVVCSVSIATDPHALTKLIDDFAQSQLRGSASPQSIAENYQPIVLLALLPSRPSVCPAVEFPGSLRHCLATASHRTCFPKEQVELQAITCCHLLDVRFRHLPNRTTYQ